MSSRLLILAWNPNEQAVLRIGFVVSKRISKRAVQRNYVKRLLSEAIRPLIKDIPLGWDLVFSARNQVVGVHLPVLVQDVYALLRRARLLDGPKKSGNEELNTRKGS